MQMIIPRLKSQRQTPLQQGFTMVEVMIAGVIMAFVLAGAGRMNISALARSSNQAQRQRIEAAINNNIQMLQMEDSYLRLDALENDLDRQSACNAPAQTLATVLAETVDPPLAEGVSQSITRVFTPLTNSDLDILLVEYSFIAPEHQGKNDALNHKEIRTVELNPNFTARCYTTST